MVNIMARNKQLDIETIIAKNPKISRADLAKGAEVLRELESPVRLGRLPTVLKRQIAPE